MTKRADSVGRVLDLLELIGVGMGMAGEGLGKGVLCAAPDSRLLNLNPICRILPLTLPESTFQAISNLYFGLKPNRYKRNQLSNM